MARVKATHSAYQILEDIIVLVGGVAKLGRTLAAQKIQSTADAATNFVSDNLDPDNINEHLSEARESLGQVADYASNTEVKQMMDDAAVFARRHPFTSIISVVAAGALIGTLIRANASAPEAPEPRARTQTRKPRAKSTRSSVKTRSPRAAKENGSARANA